MVLQGKTFGSTPMSKDDHGARPHSHGISDSVLINYRESGIGVGPGKSLLEGGYFPFDIISEIAVPMMPFYTACYCVYQGNRE